LTKPIVKRRRGVTRPGVEELEVRCVPAPVGPGTFTQNFTSNTEFNSTNGVYEIGASVAVNPGVTLQVDPGVTVLIDQGDTLTVQGALTVASGATVEIVDGNSGAHAGITVNAGSLTASGASFVRQGGTNGTDNTSVHVTNGGSISATGCEFRLDNVTFDPGTVLSGSQGSLVTGNGFDTVLTVPAVDLFELNQNLHFARIDFAAGDQVPANTTVQLVPLGTDGSAAPTFVFDGSFGVAQTGILAISNNVTVLVGEGATLTVQGSLAVSGGATVQVADGNSGMQAGITVDGGSLFASDASFVRQGGTNGTDTTSLQVADGGQLYLTGSQFSWDQLTLSASSTDTLYSNTFAAELAINSGASLSMSLNDFSSPATTVVASGATGTFINLEQNWWGTTNSTAIEAKITDEHTNSALPQVVFSPPLANAPSTAASTTLVQDNVVTYNPSPIPLTLSAEVASTGATVDEGTMTFLVFDVNGNEIGQPITGVAVNDGSASTAFTLPAGQSAGFYSVVAVYSGGPDFQGSVSVFPDSGEIAVQPADSTTSASSAKTSFSEAAQDVTLKATVTSTVGTVNQGTVTFFVRDSESNLIGSQVSGGAVTNGAASAVYSLPAGTAAGTYTIQAVYSPGTPSNLQGSASSGPSNGNLTVSAATTTTAASGASTPYSAAAQTVTLTATVTSPGGAVNEGTVAFTVFNSHNVQIGSQQSGGTVANGSASATYTLPAGTAIGSYTIQAAYTDASPGNFQGSTSSGTGNGTLTVNSLATTTTATGGVTPFSEASQTVTLTATVTSTGGTVNEGTVTFAVFNSHNVQVGSQLSGGAVASGAASATYTLPAGTAAGSYTVQATYSDSNGIFQTSTSSGAGNGTLAIGQASTSTMAVSTTATFGPAQQITLTATVTSPVGTVNEGTVSFAVFNSQNVQVGSQLSGGTVANGSASATYSLPMLAVGSYSIHAQYSDSSPGDFSGSTDSSHSLVVQANTSTAAGTVAPVTFSTSPTNITLTATVTSTGGTVGEGTVTFTLLNSQNNPVGTPVTSGTVSAGSATAMYTVPGGTPAGTYTIRAQYSDGSTGLFSGSTDSSRTLTVQAAATTTQAMNAGAIFNQSGQTVALSATVTSAAGTVGEGTVTFTVFSGSTMIGSPVTSGTVSGGSATANFTLPAGTAPAAYTIDAQYTDASPGNFLGSNNTASPATLTVSQASTTTAVSTAAVTSGTAAQSVTLHATVSSTGGTVNQGTVTFTILQGNTPVGQAVTSGTVTGGSASVTYALPAGLAIGQYTIQANYSGSADFSAGSGTGKFAVDEPPTFLPINSGSPIGEPVTQFPVSVPLGASSLLGIPLNYTFSVVGDSQLFDVQQQYHFTGVGYFAAGASAYVLHSSQSGPGVAGYYLIRPSDGALFAYDGSGSYSHSFNGTALATLGANVYTDPTLLLNAQAPVDYPTLYNLQQQYQFQFVGNFTAGATADVLHSNQSGTGVAGYYLLGTNGVLVPYDGSGSYAHSFANGTPLATLSPTVYSFPSELVNAEAAPSLYAQLNQLQQQYDLQEIGGSFYTNTDGHQAKWVYSPVLNQFGQHWYTLTLNTAGTQAILTAWEGYADSEVGAVIATLDPSVYANPTLLTNATALPAPAVTPSVDNSGNLSIGLPAGYAGSFKLTVTASDGYLSSSQSVQVTATDTAPTLTIQQSGTTIPQGGTQTVSHLSFPASDTVTTSDADGGTVTTTASAASFSLPFSLQQRYQFRGLGYFTAGATAYVLQGVGSNSFGNPYYLLSSTGALYAYDGSGSYAHTIANVTPLATLGANTYTDPTLLTNAQPAVDYTTLYNLMQQYQFTAVGTFTAGATALVLHSNQTGPGVGGYYLLAPDGILVPYDGSGSYAHSFANGTPLATLDPGVYVNPSLLLNARATPAIYDQLYQVEQQYDLQEIGGSFYTGLRGNAAKWLYSPIPNADGQNFYTLVLSANGTQALLYAWDGGSSSVPASGQPLAVLDASVYADPTLLLNAKAPQVATGVTASVSGGVLTLDAPASFVGSFQVTVTATDGVLSTTQTFQVNSTDTPPVPNAIPATSASHSGAPVQVTLGATDAEGDPVTYSAQAVGYSAAYSLQQVYHFTGLGYATVGGVSAYVLQSSVLGGVGGFYLLNSSGGVYAYDGSGSYAHTFANSANLIATLDPSVYTTPTLLTSAQAPAAPAAVLTVSGSTLTVNVAGVSPGTVFRVIVSASDGAETLRTGFLVTVTT
jgi:hypothetical protein